MLPTQVCSMLISKAKPTAGTSHIGPYTTLSQLLYHANELKARSLRQAQLHLS